MDNGKSLIWDEIFKIRAYEVTPDGKVSIQNVCNFLQETAGNHAHHLGLSVEQLYKQKMTWVLSRLHVQMTAYPFWRQKMRIQTWPSQKDGLFAIRDFRIFDQHDRKIGVATSSWMMINLVNRRPLRIPDELEKITNQNEGRALKDEFDKLPELKDYDYEKPFQVRLSDIDMNRHVNNVKYIEWGLESIPQSIWRNHRLSDLQISFKAESNYGERILSKSGILSGENSNQFGHKLHNAESGKELARMVSEWQ
ncbi:MAG: acyl-[acyl-carrier-protein] thioesterase [Caldithrix sp.]|nr:acyl-[acyl-carrier-protein] thioesterase [Caldithrix sp.]